MDDFIELQSYESGNSCFNHSDVLLRRYKSVPIVTVSGLLSVLGSMLIMYTYLRWKDVRQSTVRVILFWLAVADLLSALSFVIASLLHYLYKYFDQGVYQGLCTANSIITTYFPKTAILWTVILAVYFVLTLVFKVTVRKKARMMLLFHLISWVAPLVVVIPAAAMGWLGHGQSTQGATWCFVSDRLFENKSFTEFDSYMSVYFTVEAICGVMWDVGAIICVMGCYVLILSCNRCRWRRAHVSDLFFSSIRYKYYSNHNDSCTAFYSAFSYLHLFFYSWASDMHGLNISQSKSQTPWQR